MTARVAPLLRERLREQGSLALFEDVEMPLGPRCWSRLNGCLRSTLRACAR